MSYGNLLNDTSQRRALEALLAGENELPVGWAGPGSVPRSVAEKLAETVSVKDFGAVGDGEADDTAALQLAIDEAHSRVYSGWGSDPIMRGCAVVVPSGNYAINSPIYLRNGVRLVGYGKRATQIYAASDFDGDQMIRIGSPADPAGTFGASLNHLTVGMRGLSNLVGLDNPEGQEQCGAYDVLFRSIGANSIGYRQDGSLAAVGDQAANCNVERCEFFPAAATATCAIIRDSSWKNTYSSNQMVSTSTVGLAAAGLIVDNAPAIINGCHCEWLTSGIKIVNGGFLVASMVKGNNNGDLLHLDTVGRVHIAFAMETGGVNVINDVSAGRTIAATAVSLYVRDGGVTNNVFTTNASQESTLRGGLRLANGAIADALYGLSGTINAQTIAAGAIVATDVTVTGVSALYSLTATLNVLITGDITVNAVLKASNTVRVIIRNAGGSDYSLAQCAARVFAIKVIA